MHGNLIDLTDQRFGKWTVLERAKEHKGRGAVWLCRCDCGREKIVRSSDLRSGDSKGCRSCQNMIHGQEGTRLYRAWRGMITRCENANCKAYKNYGGRGIRICKEWHDAATFIKWALANGYKEGLTVDRIDNNGNYEPKNCQWITRSENVLKAWHVDGSYGEKHLTVS